VAPAKTPVSIIEQLNRELVKIVSDPEVKSAWSARGEETEAMTPAEFAKFVADEIQKWGQIAKAANVKID
jgi:tripartite-type tricarboxylate transporter receptor subunit TctC